MNHEIKTMETISDDNIANQEWFLIYKIHIDRVRISWNPITSSIDTTLSKNDDQKLTFTKNRNSSSIDHSYSTRTYNRHDHNLDHYHLTAMLLSSLDENLDDGQHCDKFKTITAENLQRRQSNDGQERRDIHFHSQEINLRCSIRFQYDNQKNDLIKFDHRNRICRLTLEHFQSNITKSSQSFLRRINKNRSEKIGFLDLDLLEEFCSYSKPKSIRKTSMILLSTYMERTVNFKSFSNNDFCFELWYTVECQLDEKIARSSISCVRRQNLSSIAKFEQKLKQKLSSKIDTSPANDLNRDIELKYNDSLPSDYFRRSLLNLFSWFLVRSSRLQRLYRIAIHFGQIEHLELTHRNGDSINTLNPVWACFQVKYHRSSSFISPLPTIILSSLNHLMEVKQQKQKQIHQSTISCRTSPRKLHRSIDDASLPLASFDENFVFFTRLDIENSPQTYLSIGDGKNILLSFNCPLVDYLRQPSVNQYFYLEDNRYKKHSENKSYCTLQFSIVVKPIE